MKNDLDVWARISEIVTAVIVVVSLIYIAIELDRNTRATYTSSWETVTANLISLDIAEATQLGGFIETVENDPDQVTADEYFRFSRIAQSRLAVIEYAFLGTSNQTLNDFYWGALEGYLKHIICKPGYQKYWDENGDIWHPNFFGYVDALTSSCRNSKSR